MILIAVLCVSRKDVIETGQKAKDREWPVAHVIRLPQLCLDEQLNGGSGFLREENIAQVCPPPDSSCSFSCISLQGLAERLQLTSLTSHLCRQASPLGQGLYSKEMALESSPLEYLARCCVRANREMSRSDAAVGVELIQKSKQLIGKMAG